MHRKPRSQDADGIETDTELHEAFAIPIRSSKVRMTTARKEGMAVTDCEVQAHSSNDPTRLSADSQQIFTRIRVLKDRLLGISSDTY